MKKLLTLTLCLSLLSACTPETDIDTISYLNDSYGFSLELPLEWEGYIVTERELEWGEAGNSPSYDFGFETYPEIFNISIHSLEQWETITSFEGPMPSELGRNEEWVIGGSGSHDAPEEFSQQRGEVSEILESFTWP